MCKTPITHHTGWQRDWSSTRRAPFSLKRLPYWHSEPDLRIPFGNSHLPILNMFVQKLLNYFSRYFNWMTERLILNAARSPWLKKASLLTQWTGFNNFIRKLFGKNHENWMPNFILYTLLFGWLNIRMTFLIIDQCMSRCFRPNNFVRTCYNQEFTLIKEKLWANL